jgi:hypothetical protein
MLSQVRQLALRLVAGSDSLPHEAPSRRTRDIVMSRCFLEDLCKPGVFTSISLSTAGFMTSLCSLPVDPATGLIELAPISDGGSHQADFEVVASALDPGWVSDPVGVGVSGGSGSAAGGGAPSSTTFLMVQAFNEALCRNLSVGAMIGRNLSVGAT